MKIIIGNDHAGVELKQNLVKYLEEKGNEVINVGTDTHESVDYPDIAEAVGKLVLENKDSLGIIVCGTGIWISIAANKLKGIRAALCHNELTARLARQHNDANIISLGARIIGEDLAKACVEAFLETEFEGGRHLRRVCKIDEVC